MLRVAETIERTDTGRQRRGNEDSLFARPPVFVVADGMGGARGGEVASRIAVEIFEQGLPDAGTPEERLAVLVREANREIHRRSRTEKELDGMGTTLTAAFLDDGQLAIAHVGDSRAYLLRDRVLQRLTQDHSLVDELVRRGKLTEEQAAEHPQRSIITRALGPEANVEVDTWTYPVRPGDVLMLCSDGLTSMIGEDQIAGALVETPGLREAADRLIHEANDAGGRDNITVVLFRIEDVGAEGVEQPTMVGVPVVGAPPSSARTSPAPSLSGQGGHGELTGGSARAVEAAAGSITPPATGRRPGPAPRPGRRFAKPVAAVAATVIVLALIGSAGYLATRQLYFIGTDAQGIVTVFRGLPYDLPAGIRLYETFYVSGVPASLVPADRQPALFNHHLRSQSDASSLIRALERGQLAR
ncbi:MAG: Stp1/IreP family PP2C-type Ser/Thr phosphatase [Solirubrobacteraceae bacterium]